MNRDISQAVEDRKLIAAHRGARSIAPENTMAAARLALAAGAGMWEVDVRMSRDEELVLIHDPDLRRTSDVLNRFPDRYPWSVENFSLAELKSLDFGSWFCQTDPFGQIAAGKVLPANLEEYSGEQVLTLEEALLFSIRHDWLLNIEIKDLSGLPGNEAIVEKVVSLVRSLDAAEIVLISSFNHRYLHKARNLDANIKTGVLVHSFKTDLERLMIDLGAFAFNSPVRAFKPRQVRRLKENGFRVLVWVLNNPVLAKIFLALGADGIFTDFPQRFTGKYEN